MASTIGIRVQEARRARGWTQEQLARKVRVTRQHIGRVEDTGSVSLDLLRRIAAALSVDAADLFRGTP